MREQTEKHGQGELYWKNRIIYVLKTKPILAELATHLEFSKALVEQKLLEENTMDGFEERELKRIKTSIATIFAQLELNKVECRLDSVFSMSKDE